MIYKNLSYLIIILFFVLSCRKKDDIPPVISIDYPTVNSQFSTIDSILLKGKITDDLKIKSYSISIVNSNMDIVSDVYSYSGEGSKSINLSNDFYYSNIYLSSGQYYLLVSANDGTNITNNYTKIILQGISTVLNKVIVSTQNNQTTDICNIDSGNISVLFNVADEFQDVDVNSDYQQIMLLSKTGNLFSYDANSYKLDWQKSNLNNYYSVYKSKINNFNRITYVGVNFGTLKSFNKNGEVINVYNLSDENQIPSVIYKFKNKIFTYFYTKNTQIGRIAYFYDTGNLNNYYTINLDDIIGIFNYDDNKVIILGNIGNIAKAYTLNIDNNILDEIENFSSEKIISAVSDNDGNIYYSTANKILRYNINDNASYVFVDNISNGKLFFESLNNIFYVCSSNNVLLYNENKTLINTYTANNEVLDIDFLYNKSLEYWLIMLFLQHY